MRIMAVLLLGALVGAAAVTPLAAVRVEELEVDRRELVLRLMDTQRSLTELENANRRWSNPVVRSVHFEFTNVEDSARRLQLEEALTPLVEGLIGREVRRLDPVLLLDLFKDRVWKIGETDYHLDLRAVVVGEEMRLVLEARTSPVRGPSARRG